MTDGYSGLRVVSVLEAASKSLRSGGEAVPVYYPYDHEKVLQPNALQDTGTDG